MLKNQIKNESARTVVYLIPSTQRGGAETVLLNIARYHRLEKIHPIYCFFRPGPLFDRISEISGQVYLAPQPPRLRSPQSCVQTLRWIHSILQETRAELVHSTMAYSALFGALTCWRLQLPHLWFQHGPVSGWMDILAEILPNQLILANSQHTEKAQHQVGGRLKPWLKSLFGLRRPVQVIYPGLDLPHFPDAEVAARERIQKRAEWNVGPDEFVVGLIGRPQPQKGLQLFVEALQEAAQRSATKKISGMIVGGAKDRETQGAYEQAVRKEVNRRQAPIRWLPASSRVLEIISGLDSVVCASISPEGWGLTLLEAMGLRKPVIGPNEGGPLEMIQENETGMIYPARNASELAQSIQRLAEDPTLCEKLGQQAYWSVHRRFQFQGTMDQLEQIYFTLLAGRIRSTQTDQSK